MGEGVRSRFINEVEIGAGSLFVLLLTIVCDSNALHPNLTGSMASEP